MKVARLVVTGLVAGAAAAFVAALLRPRPRRPGSYDPWADAAGPGMGLADPGTGSGDAMQGV